MVSKYTHLTIKINNNQSVKNIHEILIMEYGTASHIKSKINRFNTLSMITKVREHLKKYTTIPQNGLIIKCKSDLTIEIYEPTTKYQGSLYIWDTYFH